MEQEIPEPPGSGGQIGATARAVLIPLLLLFPALAQRQTFRYYGQEQGLSNLATECLLQDRMGYLWVGTQNGLFRYDGAVFTPFGPADGLPSSSIETLIETPQGELWVATSRGLALRRGNRFEPVQPTHGFRNSGHFGLASDPAGRLYLSTIEGLFESAPVTHRFTRIPGQPPGPAYGVHADRNGRVWFACGSGICRKSGAAIKTFGPSDGVPPDRWDALTTDSSGAVWIRSSNHLLRMAPGGSAFETVQEAVPNRGDFASLSLGRDGSLFVPTDDGVWELANGKWRGIGPGQGLSAGAVSAVLQDREGSIWIGLWGAGLARWVGRGQWEGWTRADGLSGEHVWEMLRDRRQNLWVATENGVNELRAGRSSWRVWTERDGLAGNKTRAIAMGPDGSVWTGSSPGGISRIDPETGVVSRYSLPSAPGHDRIWHLAFDRGGTLWVCTRGGLFFSAPVQGPPKFQKQDLPSGDAAETISDLLEDRQGRLWVAGTRGLACREHGVWKRFTEREGLPSKAAGFLDQAPDGSIWLGYRDRAGLSRIEVHGERLTVKTYNHRSGLASDQAIFVSVDRRGWIWFGSDRGVDVFRGGQWRHYGQQDGLIWDDCNTDAFFEDHDGSVWIGTSRGLAHFRPARDDAPAVGPRVEFTHFQLGEHVPEGNTSIQEPYRNRSLFARISVLTFLAESDVLCRYRLRGLDDSWVETKQREVRFSNLPAGRYVLEAMGRSAAGSWSSAPARVEFQILPAWWDTWWFRLAILVSVCAFVLWFVRWRTRRLLTAHARLEAAVEDRTRQLRIEQRRIELQNSEIEQLLEQAKRANVLKDEFLANMSHEIRTPINGIFGMINLALATELKPDQQQALETVNTCAQSLLGILNDVLDFSKIEAGKLEICPAPVRPADIVHGACSTFAGSAHEKGLRLEWDVAPEVPEWLECDAARIRQVLLNLVGNAIKFTHRGTIRVLAGAHHSGADHVELHFSVTDTGIGISAEARAFIFDAFRQADGSTSRTYGGTGLGLTISSRLVHLMGGRLEVESEPGLGSTFRFFVSSRPAAALPQRAKPDTHVPQPSRPLRVLLAEDNVVNQRVATALLSRRGHDVIVVSNGRAAIERTNDELFDIILMDLQMPEIDGWSATRQIRERDQRRGMYVPIVALTAHAMNEARDRCLAAGMDSVIVKPFDPSVLYTTVEELAASALYSARSNNTAVLS